MWGFMYIEKTRRARWVDLDALITRPRSVILAHVVTADEHICVLYDHAGIRGTEYSKGKKEGKLVKKRVGVYTEQCLGEDRRGKLGILLLY